VTSTGWKAIPSTTRRNQLISLALRPPFPLGRELLEDLTLFCFSQVASLDTRGMLVDEMLQERIATPLALEGGVPKPESRRPFLLNSIRRPIGLSSRGRCFTETGALSSGVASGETKHGHAYNVDGNFSCVGKRAEPRNKNVISGR
jgi:hypothetical protein